MEQLPERTQSKLRSSQILTSLPQIVSELVQNSLDAGARHVDVGVDCEDWECWVRDDGTGISRDGLDALAGVDNPSGSRYRTSKAYTPASLDQVYTFGFRGEALASAAELSCLEVSSRTARSRQSWSIILKGGQVLYNGESLRWRRESPGTVVSIRDAFYNLPIRRRSHASPPRTLELIRKEIETYALVFPHVAFSLENTRKVKDGGPDKGRVLRIPKTSSTLAAFRHLFGRALAQHIDEIDEAWGEMKLQGFVSLDGAQSKTYQYLYINHHPLSPSELQRVIDHKFSQSSFIKHAYDEEGETKTRSTTRRSPRRPEKKPVYVLDLIIPPHHVDNCLEPAKSVVHLQNSEAASRFVGSVIDVFLRRHGFLAQHSQGAPGRAETAPPSPRKKRKLTSSEGTPLRVQPPLRPVKEPPTPQHRPSSTIQTAHGSSARGENEVLWTDPATGESFVVDPRTGNSHPLLDHSFVPERVGTAGPSAGHRRTLPPSTTRPSSVPDWIKDALGANETYALTEPRIPALALSTSFADAVSRRPCRHASSTAQEISLALQDAPLRPSRISKAALRSAQVLGQVDRKFIACVIDSGGETCGERGRALVLIDQHAADERVRVERFLRELCLGFLQDDASAGVQRRTLEQPLPVLLTSHEAEYLCRDEGVQHTFARWGVEFAELHDVRLPEVDDDPGFRSRGKDGRDDPGYVQVLVSCVPAVVADKLLAGDERRDLVKGYLAKLVDEGPPHHSMTPETMQNADGSEHSWQRAVRWCPKELLDLVNSKACRGAIMFNDSLTLEQCQRLLGQLAETALPFQCAHGRPSMVPLADVGAPVEAGDTGWTAAPRSRQRAVDWRRLAKQ